MRDFVPLRESPAGRLDVRVLQTAHGRRVDIRQFVTSERFSGFTRRGVSLDAEMFDVLLDQAPEISRLLDAADGHDVYDPATREEASQR